jgi:iron(III) transport system ATP-binding protein
VVLLDEPFSNLDVEVRLRLRSELPGVLNQCGTSGLLVTHDPEEALAICDRVAVLESGRLHQIASPRALVQHPATAFVGRFVLQGNLLPVCHHDGAVLQTALGRWRCSDERGGEPLPAASEMQLLVLPEALTLEPDSSAEGLVLGREFLGREWLVQVQLGDQQLRLRLPLAQDWSRGQRCRVRPRPGAEAVLYPQQVPLRAQPDQ